VNTLDYDALVACIKIPNNELFEKGTTLKNPFNCS
jgi:hypothetical protein